MLPPLPLATFTVCAPAALLAIDTVLAPEPLASVTVVAVFDVPIADVPEPFTVSVPVTVRLPGKVSGLVKASVRVLPAPVTLIWPAVPRMLMLPPEGRATVAPSPVSCATVPEATPSCCHVTEP